MNGLNWAGQAVGRCWLRETQQWMFGNCLFICSLGWMVQGFNFINGIHSQSDFVRCGLHKCYGHDKWLTKRFNLWHILSAKTHIITMGLMFCIRSNNFSLMLIEQRHYHPHICYVIHLTNAFVVVRKDESVVHF